MIEGVCIFNDEQILIYIFLASDSISPRTKKFSVDTESNIDGNYCETNELNENHLKDIVDENEGLRKGMHEILDSIRNRDGNILCSIEYLFETQGRYLEYLLRIWTGLDIVFSVVQIESETLEQLLESLDSRHVTGWYQPAMRLQAHIHYLNGVNQMLRDELHCYR